MRESLRLGRIAGVNVGINWSVLAIFFLLAFSLAIVRFPAQYPEVGGTVHWVAALIAALLFFGSLLAHELGHALVAKRNGLEVEGITLWLFGGVARLEGEVSDPGADFRIAGVGPLISFVLGTAFLVASYAVSAAGVTGIALGVLGWLGIINIVLAVFNLLPGAPLDGGRLLRAYLWRRTGNRVKAAITAAKAGRGLGFLLIALGLVQFVALMGGGIWMALIGWFLVTAAGAEERFARVQGALEGVRVRDVMSTNPTVVPDDVRVQDFIDSYVFRHRYSTFPVVDRGGRVTGLISLRRVKELPAQERLTTRVSELACPLDEVPTSGPDDDLVDLVPRMSGCSDGRAIVIDKDEVVGVVSPVDVARRMEFADLREPGATTRI